MAEAARTAFPGAGAAGTILKSRMVDELGETALLLPESVNRALAANERAKYGLTLFQTARSAADDPGAVISELRAERETLGVGDATFLNVGLNTRTVHGLLRLTGNPQLAWDLYRRLVESFAECVRGCPREPFETALRTTLAEADTPAVQELDAESLRSLARENLDLVLELTASTS